jgi:hypothetical protein
MVLFLGLTLGSVSALAQETVTATGSGTLSRGLGVGVQAFLGGPAGVSLTYDPGNFRIDGILAFGLQSADPDDIVQLTLAARALFPLHETAVSDFSLGGGLQMDYFSAGDSDVDITLAALAQIRMFVTTNVAISVTAGLGFVLDGDDGDNTIFLGGQLQGSAGATYFF